MKLADYRKAGHFSEILIGNFVNFQSSSNLNSPTHTYDVENPQSMLIRLEVHIHVTYFNVNAWFVWHLWGLMVDTHAVHVVKKSVLMYNFHCELAVVLSSVQLKSRRVELHIDTKNKDIGAEITDTEMIHILAAYG